jgi:hypothetical protein
MNHELMLYIPYNDEEPCDPKLHTECSTVVIHFLVVGREDHMEQLDTAMPMRPSAAGRTKDHAILRNTTTACLIY